MVIKLTPVTVFDTNNAPVGSEGGELIGKVELVEGAGGGDGFWVVVSVPNLTILRTIFAQIVTILSTIFAQILIILINNLTTLTLILIIILHPITSITLFRNIDV